MRIKQVLPVVFLCVCCFASGWLCRERAQAIFERREAVKLAAQAERQAKKMLVRGTVISVLPGSIRLQVKDGTKDLRTFYYTVIVIGGRVQNQPGEADLSEHFWIGDKVSALVDRQNHLLWIRKKNRLAR
ncbi:MAG: hypothetical protein AB1426_03685 [Bacillota bacterium]